MAPRLVRTRDGRVLVYKGAQHPLDGSLGQQVLPGGQYAAPSTPSPIAPELSTRLPQSTLAPVPRSVVSPERRVQYPTRTRETEMYQRSMSPEQYLRKKTFERPAFFAIEDADTLQTAAPWIFSVLVAGPASTAVQGNLKITSEADFEAVKVMVTGRKLVDQEWVATRNFLISFQDLASGRQFNNVPINAEHFGGDANLPLILPVTLFINRNTAVSVQFINNEPVSTDIYVYFSLLGIKYYYRDALNLTTGFPEQGAYKTV